MIVLCALALPAGAFAQDRTAAEIIALERGALERWAKGDTRGFLEIIAPDITYFDPNTERRVEGADEVRAVMDKFHGKFRIDYWEMRDAKVQVSGGVAVLTYLDLNRTGTVETLWKVTEVYKKTPAGWRVWSSHFSYRSLKP